MLMKLTTGGFYSSEVGEIQSRVSSMELSSLGVNKMIFSDL